MKNNDLKSVLLTVVFLEVAFILKGQSPETVFVPNELPDQLWTDIVTERPQGYVVDENGNVHIFSAEGLAWLSVLSNGLHGQEVDHYDGKTVCLEENVNLAGYAWTPIANFKGVFNGKRNLIDNLIISKRFGFSDGGFFRDVVHGEIRNVNLENCIIDFASASSSVLACFLEDSTVVSNCSVHCLNFKASEGAMFVAIKTGSMVKNCIIHYDYKMESDFGSGISYYNYGELLNCASIIDTMYWPWGGSSGLVVENEGLIKNCYSYWGHLDDFPYYGGGLAPRNGVAEGNMGTVENCYYNRMPTELGFDDEPGGGVFQSVSSYDKEDDGWRLITPITVGGVTTHDLVEVLNLWVENQPEGDNYLKWCNDTLGSNYGLPVFVDFAFMDIQEQITNREVLIFPNPTQDKVSIKIDSPDEHETYSLELIGIDGRIVIQKTNVGDDVTLDLSDLSSGVYVLNVKGNSILHRQTIIKTE